ncbi:hypothetical protein WA158_004190 [Blastocystis sp. Blastoise]
MQYPPYQNSNMSSDPSTGYRPVPPNQGYSQYPSNPSYYHPYPYNQKEEYSPQPPPNMQPYRKPGMPQNNVDPYYQNYYDNAAPRPQPYAGRYPYRVDHPYEGYPNGNSHVMSDIPPKYPPPYGSQYPPSSNYPMPQSPTPEITLAHQELTPPGGDQLEQGGIFALHGITNYLNQTLTMCMNEMDHVAMCMYKGRQRDKNSSSSSNLLKLDDKMSIKSGTPMTADGKSDKNSRKDDVFVCPYNWCRKIRSEICHNNTCTSYDCLICAVIKPLVYIHSTTCRLNPCPIARCQEYKANLSRFRDLFLEDSTIPMSYYLFGCLQNCDRSTHKRTAADCLMDEYEMTGAMSASTIPSMIPTGNNVINNPNTMMPYTASSTIMPNTKSDETDRSKRMKTSSVDFVPSSHHSSVSSITAGDLPKDITEEVEKEKQDAFASIYQSINSNSLLSMNTKRRKSGYIYVTCTKCKKRRAIPNTLNPSYLTNFTCKMNIWDPQYRSCESEEHIYKEGEPYIDISLRDKEYHKYYRAFIDELQSFAFGENEKKRSSPNPTTTTTPLPSGNKMNLNSSITTGNSSISIDDQVEKKDEMDIDITEEPSRKNSILSYNSIPTKDTTTDIPAGTKGSVNTNPIPVTLDSRHNSIDQSYSSTMGSPAMNPLNPAIQRRDMLKIPTFGRREVDLYRLFREVCAYGGCEAVVAREGTWAYIYRSLENYSPTETSASFRLKKMYSKYLLDYEKYLYNFPPPSSFKRGRGRGASMHYTTPVYTSKTDVSDQSMKPLAVHRERSTSLEEMPESRDKDTLKVLLSLKNTFTPTVKPKSSPKWEALLNVSTRTGDTPMTVLNLRSESIDNANTTTDNTTTTTTNNNNNANNTSKPLVSSISNPIPPSTTTTNNNNNNNISNESQNISSSSNIQIKENKNIEKQKEIEILEENSSSEKRHIKNDIIDMTQDTSIPVKQKEMEIEIEDEKVDTDETQNNSSFSDNNNDME